jgi:chemotaxis protein methyltransferase CheR
MVKAQPEKEFNCTFEDFDRVRGLIYQRAGIALNDSKYQMVYTRLARRLRIKGIASFNEYLNRLESGRDPDEWEAFTNALTTNLTSFFREEHHFPLLAEFVSQLQSKEPISIWCSASSTGEEPYSIAITVCEAFEKMDPPVKILATDIDTHVLQTASQGIYSMERLEKMSSQRIKNFFLKGVGSYNGQVRVRPELRRLIEFKQLNLLSDNWPIHEKLDAIFCRNVMIYFDKPTQKKLLERFASMLKPHGLLFIGHSENFAYLTKIFRLRGKTVYELSD